MKFNRLIITLILGLLIGSGAYVNAHAEGNFDITFTTADYESGYALQQYLDYQRGSTPKYDMLTITLAPGEYSFDACLCVYSNTTIKANGATIYYTRRAGNSDGKNPIIFNDAEGAYGYDGASNITIDGGIWDLQGQPGQAMYGKRLEGIRFMHCKNITVKNLTIQNMYTTHMLTIEGVDGATVTNCTFKHQYMINQKKEAIHIDSMHNYSMAPSSQNDIKYDDTFTNNLVVDSCTFEDVPRGIGTHIAVEGCYPDNITITNNTFNDITYEAVKAYCYKNFTIKNNYIKLCGIGIKAYNYVPASETDGTADDEKPYQKPNDGVIREKNPSSFNGVIEKNTIVNATRSNAFGIHLQGCKERPYRGVYVYDNIISNSGKIGIYAKGCEDIILEKNTITDSSGMGIDIGDSKDCDVFNNTIDKAKALGVCVKNGSGNVIRDNTIKTTTKQNIYAVNCSNVTIDNNDVTSGKKGGIGIDKGCKSAKITNNKVKSAGKNGISISEISSPTVKGNTVTSPKNFGLYFFKTTGGTITGNTIKNAKKSGIVVHKTNKTNIKKNTIEKTGQYGILFSGTKKSFAYGNKIKKAKSYKVLYANSCKNKKKNIK